MGNKTGERKRCPPAILFAWLALLCCMGNFPGQAAETEPPPPVLHERAVALARQGKYDEAVFILKKLIEEQPGNRAYLFDYIVVLSWAEKDEQVMGYGEFLDRAGDDAPVYVLAAAAKSARRQREFAKALRWYGRVLSRRPDHLPARVGLALIDAEKGNLAAALEKLIKLEPRYPRDTGLKFALAYVYRLRGEFFPEMVCYRRILEIEPANRAAKKGLIICASTLGAPRTALEILGEEKEPGFGFSPAALEQIRADLAAQRVRWGQVTPASEEKRYEETDMALELLEANTYRLKEDPALPRRFLRRAQFDRLIALRQRIRMKETVTAYENLVEEGVPIPYYGLLPAADAYLFLSRPKRAKKIYEQVLVSLQPSSDDKPTARRAVKSFSGGPGGRFFKKAPLAAGGINAGLSLFYAYLESEKYRAAGQWINVLARELPTWFRVKNSRAAGENPDKLAADISAVMFHAYAGQLKKARARMEHFLFMAPDNRNIRAQLAKIFLWRGWPRKALRQLQLVLAREPRHFEARIWLGHTLMALHKYDKAAGYINKLWEIFPEKKAVQKLKRDWNTLHLWYFHSEMTGARGEGQVLGAREFSSENYLYSPPIHNRFRGYMHYYGHAADFYGNRAQHERWGVGIDYNRGDLGGQIELLRRLSGDPDYGFHLGGRWHMNDYWQLSGNYAHNEIDIPLKGRVVDLKGNRAGVRLTWRPSELDRIEGNYTFTDFNDGNRRHALLLSGCRRLVSGAKFFLYMDAELYTSANRLTQRYYFNPEQDASGMITLDARWTMYRFYDFKFVQRLAAGYGAYRQKHYGTGAMWVIRYEHHWDFDDRKALLYGIRLSRRFYDGRPENGTMFYVTVDWRF